MKLNRKWILVMSLVLSVALATSGTLAYLTDTESKENVFILGNVDISLDEGAWKDDSALLPGVEVAKEPAIKNDGKTDAWVWMEISIPTALYSYLDLDYQSEWIKADDVTIDDENTIVTLKYKDILGAGLPTSEAFTKVTLSKDINADADGNLLDANGNKIGWNIADNPKIIVTAYAIQDKPFTDVDEAIKAYNGEEAGTWDGTSDTTWYNDTDTEFTITTAEQLAGLAELVDGGNTFAGKTVKLGKDINLNAVHDDGNRVSFNPIGHSSNEKSFNGTFDGQGHTITNLYMQNDLGAWQYEGEYYALFAYTNGATIQNVTVADARISSGRNEAAAVVGNAVDTTFTDISIKNTTLIAYNNSAGGVAAECYGNCSFTNITVDEDTVIGPLWGTYDVRLGGVVGLVHAGNSVSFSNVNVSCKLDAINDVAANYQYWLYRYCGMLIGEVDGVNGVADPTGYVTCEDVTVTYGDWVNYHYCEFEDLGAGSYNGLGEYKYARVEAGTGTDGIDLSACNHDEDESHNVLIVFDQLFGGGQGVKGLKTYDGVNVIYN